jgi:uncharacterized membrane protein
MKIQASAAKIPFLISKISKRIWFRAFLYGLIGVTTAFFAFFAKGIVPDEISTKIGADAVANILTILASSMLAVATFSLSIMVTAFGNVSSNATPRATRLLIENQSAQRAVATFIGAFLYSIVAIIALATNAYGSEGRFILFLVTIAVIVVIVVTLIKWVDQLSTLGQVGNTLAEIEKATLCAIGEWAQNPFLGGRPLDDQSFSNDVEPVLITSDKVGFVVLIDTRAIQKICEEFSVDIFLMVLPGSFIYPDRPLAFLSSNVDSECLKSLAAHFAIEESRTFDQDPRFGFILLAEIASRALSPGINDPGTALDVIGTASRLLKLRTDIVRKANEKSRTIKHSRVYVPMLTGDELIGDVFVPIARDGAGFFEVGIRIQKSLRFLKSYDPHYKAGCELYADFTEKHSNQALKTQYEKDLVANARRQNSRIIK